MFQFPDSPELYSNATSKCAGEQVRNRIATVFTVNYDTAATGQGHNRGGGLSKGERHVDGQHNNVCA